MSFAFCHSLRNIYIPNSVTKIGSNAFRKCSSLESIEIPYNVTNIAVYAFNRSSLNTIYGCSGSYAETYASNNSFAFVSTGEMPHPAADIDGDGQVTNRDALRILQYLAGWSVEVDTEYSYDYYGGCQHDSYYKCDLKKLYETLIEMRLITEEDTY